MRLVPAFSRTLKCVLIASAALLLCACSAVGYYGQAVSGQFYILTHRQDIDALLEDPATDPQLKARLGEVRAIRRFAADELDLPLDSQFSTYVDLGRPYVVWNVFAADEFSVKPRSWCYPVAGCVAYRGYFDEDSAQDFASGLREQGLDVYVGGVAAYSTLGWFSDPLLNTVLNRREHQLAALIFHELAHQVAYAKGDTEFNESFATAVEREGQRRWLQMRMDETARRGVEETIANELRRQQQFVALVQGSVADLDMLYRSDRDETQKRTDKAARLNQLREDYAAIKSTEWGGYAGYDAWFAAGLNNAQLATVATYNALTPAFAALLEQERGDMPAFYARVQELAKLSYAERRARLQALLDSRQLTFASP